MGILYPLGNFITWRELYPSTSNFGFDKCLETTPTGSKLLVPDDVPTDKAINQLQQFILRNRDTVQDPDSNRSLTFHGLRHTYAAEKYRQLIADGFSELDAHLTVSRLLGHERADVTNIYLASVKQEGGDAV
jgi:integrase